MHLSSPRDKLPNFKTYVKTSDPYRFGGFSLFLRFFAGGKMRFGADGFFGGKWERNGGFQMLERMILSGKNSGTYEEKGSGIYREFVVNKSMKNTLLRRLLF